MSTLPNPKNQENMFLILAGCLLLFLLLFFVVVCTASCQYMPSALRVTEHMCQDVQKEIQIVEDKQDGKKSQSDERQERREDGKERDVLQGDEGIEGNGS